MANISMDDVKALREKTGVSVMQCRKALEDANCDMDKALVLLQKRGAEAAAKKSDRTAGSGRVVSYIHGGGTVGVLIELRSETDFVSKNEGFEALARDIAMQIAATNPLYITKEEITEADKTTATEVFAEEVKDKPEAMREKILTGKLDAYFKDKILLEQDYIKDPNLTVNGFIQNAIQRFGEKIEVARFVRFDTMK